MFGREKVGIGESFEEEAIGSKGVSREGSDTMKSFNKSEFYNRTTRIA
jgi:hypothetical protein